MLQGDIGQAFKRRDEAIADDLDLRLVRDRLQIWVEYGSLTVDRLAVSVGGCRGIEALCDMELRLWSYVRLVLEDQDLMMEQGIADDVKVGICTSC